MSRTLPAVGVITIEGDLDTVRDLQRDWLLYGEMHMTNAPGGHGLTRLDPTGITYTPPPEEEE